MASVTPQLSNLPLEDPSAVRSQPTMSSIEAKVESVVGINIASLQQELSNDSNEDYHLPHERQLGSHAPVIGDRSTLVTVGLPNSSGTGSPQKIGTNFQGQGQHFEPMDKSVSQTVKLNPKMELSKPDLLKLLSYMEAELQARDVVIATLKTERIKNLLHYGRVGVNDPFLALQRDSIGGQVFGGGSVSEGELRSIEETQLQQLENLITQQRKAHQRMRQVLREAEKRHSWTVHELEKERRKHENENCPADEVSDNIENDDSKLKQFQELDSERAGKKKIEKELKKLQETLEEERGKQKQIILMLVEERKRLALQYVEERKRSEDLAQILSEEKGRIDAMAEGLEEESKKSLQMEAELEKQLAEFDTEKQQMAAQLARKDERIFELEALAEKLQREVEHYKKQLQEAHNVAMFQQTLSVSPPRIGIGTSPQRPQPPQLPVKPASLTQGPSRLQGAPAHSNVTKAVQLTATVNSVPVAGPTTGIARGVQPGVGVRATMYSSSSNEINRPITSTAKTYSESENAWVGGSVVECDSSSAGSTSSSTTPQGGERSLVRVSGVNQVPQVVQVSPRVNVSASSSNKVITTSHGGKVTFHVTTNASSGVGGSPGSDQTILKKPAPPTRSSQSGGPPPPPPVPLNKPVGAPPIPPNKPIVPPKKVVDSPPISVEVKPQKVGPQTVKFGITISKTSGNQQQQQQQQQQSTVSSNETTTSLPSASSTAVAAAAAAAVSPVTSGVEGVLTSRRESSQVEEEAKCEMHECVDSLCHELENFHQLLSSMADNTDLVENPSQISLVSPHCPSGPALYSSCEYVTPPSVSDVEPKKKVLDSKVLFSSSSLTIANENNTCQGSQSVCCDAGNSSSSLSSTVLSSSSSSSSSLPSLSPSSIEKNSTPCSVSHLLVNSFPSVSECEDSSSASTQACKGPPMSIPQLTASSSPCSSSIPSPPTSSLSSSSPTLLRPQFLPVDSQLDSNLDDCAPPPHSPIDVATPLTADGMTALHLAAQGNNWQSVAVLVRCGSSVTAEDDEGRTPLYLALLYGCVPAAKALLAFPQCLEHTTKSGCNLLHAATKSGEVECVMLITRHIINAPESGLSLLHLLATLPDHHGQTPIALALAATSPLMVQVFTKSGIDLKALTAHNPQLLHIASPASIAKLAIHEDEEIPCSVWITGTYLSVDQEREEKWAAGTVFVSSSMQWDAFEADVISVLKKHWEALDKCSQEDLKEDQGCNKDSITINESEFGFGLSEASVDCFTIGGYCWKKGNPKNCISSPFDLMKKNSDNCSSGGTSQVVVQLYPLSSAAYTYLIPIYLLQSYVRLLDQSKCVVIYGVKDNGKRSLAGILASLRKHSVGEDVLIQAIDASKPASYFILAPSVKEALDKERILVLERLPRESWNVLRDALNSCSSGSGGGVILVTIDNWRKPAGHLECDASWIQLRHDRPPIRNLLSRILTRQITSMAAGREPPLKSLCGQTIRWVNDSQGHLSETVMSLGFSPVLRGPKIFAEALSGAFNPTDIVRGVEEVWNKVLVPSILEEIRTTLKSSQLSGGNRTLNESRVSAMALYIIFQNSFLSSCPQHPKDLILRFQDRNYPHQKGTSPKTNLQKTVSYPTSPEWNEANLAKILGLPPLGYT